VRRRRVRWKRAGVDQITHALGLYALVVVYASRLRQACQASQLCSYSKTCRKIGVGPFRDRRYPADMTKTSLIEHARQLSATDRLELIEAIWESLQPNELPVSDQEKALIDDRLADLERNPTDQSPWSDIKARLERRNR